MASIYLSKGSVSRLAFGPTIKKGQWYVGVACHQCQKPILVLEERTYGQSPPNFIGEGKLSIPCRSCEHDDLYASGEMKAFKAAFNSKSFRDERPDPSGAHRQPLLPKHKGATITFGIGALEQRPEAAKIVARCIAYWTDVETNTASLLERTLF